MLIVERYHDIDPKWHPVLRQLPKGGCYPGESLEETALREVMEETGYPAEIIGKAGEAHWSYERGDITWDETVHYYLMRPLVDPLSVSTFPAHDDEFDVVCWIPLSRASETVSYQDERSLLSSAALLAAIEASRPPI